jgi:hypothetical protein
VSGLLLTPEERDRFVGWLEREADSTEVIVRQMAQIKVPEVVIRNFQIEVAACRLIARKLRRTESL